MLDKFTQRLMDSLHKGVQDKIIPMRDMLRSNVNSRMDLGSKALKFGTMLLVLFGIIKMKDNDRLPPKNDPPSTIVINNYLYDQREKEEKE